MKNVCVICDSEKNYACKFIEYLNNKKTLPFNGVACTNKQSLIDYAHKNPIDILLVAESIMDEDIGAIPAVVIIVLGEGLRKPECDGYQQIYKYQACDNLIRDVMEYYSEKQFAIREFAHSNKKIKEVIGVYSPCGGCAKTSLALAVGSNYAESKKVLFVDMTLFSGLDLMLGIQAERGLSDLLYYCGEGKKNLEAKLQGMTCERLGMDMVPPLVLAEDLTGISSERWRMLFDLLAEKSIYDVLVLDIGIPSFGILDYCTKIYVPMQDNPIAKEKVKSFRSSLARSKYGEVDHKIRTIIMPDKFTSIKENFYDSGEFQKFKAWALKTMKGNSL